MGQPASKAVSGSAKANARTFFMGARLLVADGPRSPDAMAMPRAPACDTPGDLPASGPACKRPFTPRGSGIDDDASRGLAVPTDEVGQRVERLPGAPPLEVEVGAVREAG